MARTRCRSLLAAVVVAAVTVAAATPASAQDAAPYTTAEVPDATPEAAAVEGGAGPPPGLAPPPTAACTAAVAECLATLGPGGTCGTPLPVPPSSMPPALRGVGYNLTPLRSGVYSYYDGAYHSLLLRDGGHLGLVDFPDSAGSNTPDGSGTRLTDALVEVMNGTAPAAVAMIYSHAHYDHIGGASRVAAWLADAYPNARVTVYGTASTAELVERSTTKRAVAPTVLVTAPRTVLMVGTHEVRLLRLGGHAGADLAIHLPPTCGDGGGGGGGGGGGAPAPGIVHFVDVVFPGWAPFVNLALTTSVRAYVDAHAAVLALDWSIFSGGHLSRLGSRADVELNRAFALDLLAAGAAGVATVTGADFGAAGLGAIADAASPVAGNLWFAFLGVVRPLQVDVCVRRMLEGWGCTLAGLDFTVRSHCFTAVSYAVLEA